MNTSYNLADRPWIGVLAHSGPAILSLTEVFKNATTIRQVATGNPLADAAITQLLLAISFEADGKEQQWLEEHHDRLDLMHPEHPFGQYAPLQDFPDYADDASSFLYGFDVAANSFSSYDSNIRAGIGFTLTPMEAAHLLLIRQHYSVGGILGGLNKKAGGQNSAKTSLDLNFPFIYPQTVSLDTSLGLMKDVLSAGKAPKGVLHLGMSPTAKLSTPIEKPGILDVLTYPSRAMKLTFNDDGLVHKTHYAEGKRLEATDLTPELWPQTTWEQKKKDAPWVARKIHLERPAWRQILENTTGDQPGILATGALPAGTPISLTTMAAYTSRIDGFYHQHTLVPVISTEELQELRDHIADVNKKIYSDGGMLARAVSESDRNKVDALASQTREDVSHQLGRIVQARMAGKITQTAVADETTRIINKVQQQRIRDHITVRPVATSKVAARYATETRKTQ